MTKTFHDYADDKDEQGEIFPYVAYKASQEGVPLAEAARRSLARLFDLMQANQPAPIAIFTAFRGENTIQKNRSLNRDLEGDLRKLGWGYVPVFGGFTEKIRDESGKETGKTKKVDSEESYFVFGGGEKNKFLTSVQLLLAKYRQEGAVVKLPDEPQAYLLAASGERTPLGNWSLNQAAEYYTRMRKGPPGRQFTFECAGDSSRTTRMVVERMRNFERHNGR